MITIIDGSLMSTLLLLQILMCFTIGLSTLRFIAYGVFGLLIEVNTVFLHLRQLLHIAGVPKISPIFRINSFINIGQSIQYLKNVIPISDATWHGSLRVSVGQSCECGSAELLLIQVVITVVIDSDRSLPVDTFNSAQTVILCFNLCQLQGNAKRCLLAGICHVNIYGWQHSTSILCLRASNNL